MRLSPSDKLSISDKLAQEYMRVPRWCNLSDNDPHSARVAIRCVAVRLGVYASFNEAVENFGDKKEGDA